MATYNFLWCVNRLCRKLNEVELDSTTFASATGVYADFKDSVNAAISDIYKEEDTNWPFALTVGETFDTVVGQELYTPPSNVDSIDWDSFVLDLPLLSTTIVQVGGVATATTSTNHLLVTNDQVVISGANQNDYNGTFGITVTSPTTFTFNVGATAVSPATGTIISVAPTSPVKLIPIDEDAYREEYQHMLSDKNRYKVGQFLQPRVVVRRKDNKIIMSPKPDRQYRIIYDYYTLPTDMNLYSDVPSIPEKWRETVVKGAIYYAYMFRDNADQAAGAQQAFTDDVNKMRRILIPQPHFFRIVN